jgi:hypothetical protein
MCVFYKENIYKKFCVLHTANTLTYFEFPLFLKKKPIFEVFLKNVF